MKIKTLEHRATLAVVGAGIAGCAAVVFALKRGIDTVQIGNTGALAYTSGYLDLLGENQGTILENPWQGLEQLRNDEPCHPYARIDDRELRQAFAEFIAELSDMGLAYTEAGGQNHFALLPAGAVKQTYSLPETMCKVDTAFTQKAPTLIIDFVGLQGFSAAEIVANLKPQWPQLRAQRVAFPDMESGAQVFPEVMARAMEVADTRVELAKRINEVVTDEQYIALPAMLGIHRPDLIHKDLEKHLGLPVFEIPTMPPAVPGIRLREMMEQQLSLRGAAVVSRHQVNQVTLDSDTIKLQVHDNYAPIVVEADYLLLASGRFLSGGLKTDRRSIHESLLGLPVKQPHNREQWFSEAYFDRKGHPVNRSGVMVNDQFQVVDEQGVVIDDRLYAAGILLADQDWIRQRSGVGIALASAYKAICSLQQRL